MAKRFGFRDRTHTCEHDSACACISSLLVRVWSEKRTREVDHRKDIFLVRFRIRNIDPVVPNDRTQMTDPEDQRRTVAAVSLR